MLVTFISQCEKKALLRTRRILDAFANRIGDNVWQTAITEQGLATVYKLLRQTASKSTAVSCHRVRTRQRMELQWIVGNRRRFNTTGQVPVNRTRRNLLHQDWENSWQNLSALHIVSVLAALLHDIGKSTRGFQQKLLSHQQYLGDPYRHEWLSLKLFMWLVQGCQSDDEVWQRLQHLADYLQDKQPSVDELLQTDQANLHTLPPIAQWLAWLIVTHHRLPPFIGDYWLNAQQRAQLLRETQWLTATINEFYQYGLKACDYWTKNPHSMADKTDFFAFDACVWHSPTWQAKVKRYAQKAQADVALKQWSKAVVGNPFLLILSRLCLMVGDYTYSSLPPTSHKRLTGSLKRVLQHQQSAWLLANTFCKKANQTLDEHLLGVAHYTAQICRALPVLHKKMPKLVQHQALLKNTAHPQYRWQNQAFQLALRQQEASEKQGFFGINMASTGCGKTLGNVRIMYALAPSQEGARITIALGLRVLTLQTGQSLREKLALNHAQMAVLVGGDAQKQLFELNQVVEEQIEERELSGSLSAEPWLNHYVDGDEQDCLAELSLDHAITEPNARKLLAAPLVSCTLDQLISASECTRGGAYIAPVLRLLSSDLILDEPDDFDLADLPALSRLVHLAGLLGSRVLLSSATLPPDLVQGLYQAYTAGRKLYNTQFHLPDTPPIAAWFDENHCVATSCVDTQHFAQQHDEFIAQRCQFLATQPVRRAASILPLNIPYHRETQKQFYQDLASHLLAQAHALHEQHALCQADGTVSVGLIRMANIQPLMQLAQALFQYQDVSHVFPDTQFHLCCYHSNQLLLLRNVLEQRLDKILQRTHVSDEQFIQHEDIARAIAQFPNKKHHIFMVLATAVAEVGRDHDYDWALVEPSSMRSIIQLAGRVWRHRPDKVAHSPNMAIWQFNIKALKKEKICFNKPGFEQSDRCLVTHDIAKLIQPVQLQKIDATPRIYRVIHHLDAQHSLVDLEHDALHRLMNHHTSNVVNAYWREESANRQHIHLIQLTPFRFQMGAETDFVFAIQDDGNMVVREWGAEPEKQANTTITVTRMATDSSLVSPWLGSSLAIELARLAEQLPDMTLEQIQEQFARVSLRSGKTWWFDERFGCWERE